MAGKSETWWCIKYIGDDGDGNLLLPWACGTSRLLAWKTFGKTIDPRACVPSLAGAYKDHTAVRIRVTELRQQRKAKR